LPPLLDASGVLAIAAARDLLIPFSRGPSYCLSSFTPSARCCARRPAAGGNGAVTTFAGKPLIEAAAGAAGYHWLVVVFIGSSAMTGAAVLRVAGRVFLG